MEILKFGEAIKLFVQKNL